jgi:hypothetical protein
MCLNTQQCTADQTSTSEKHVYIKAVFRHCDVMMYIACMQFPRPRDLALLEITLRQVGASGESGPLFRRL